MQNELRVGVNRGWVRDDGIIFVDCGDGKHDDGGVYAKMDALDARALYEKLEAKNQPNFVLCDITKIKRTDTSARSISPPPGVSRIALLIKSPVSKLLGNVYLTTQRSLCPTRLFLSEFSAIDWLKSGMAKS